MSNRCALELVLKQISFAPSLFLNQILVHKINIGDSLVKAAGMKKIQSRASFAMALYGDSSSKKAESSSSAAMLRVDPLYFKRPGLIQRASHSMMMRVMHIMVNAIVQ